MNTLIKNASVLLPDGSVKVADIAIENDRIAAVGSLPEGWLAFRAAAFSRLFRRTESPASRLPFRRLG